MKGLNEQVADALKNYKEEANSRLAFQKKNFHMTEIMDQYEKSIQRYQGRLAIGQNQFTHNMNSGLHNYDTIH